MARGIFGGEVTIVLVSGPISSGKSSLARYMADRYSFCTLSTRDLIQQLAPGRPRTRRALQAAGEQLDEGTGGGWVAKGLLGAMQGQRQASPWLVDAVRTLAQIKTIRDRFPGRIVHVHLSAPTDLLRARFEADHSRDADEATYDDVRNNRTERLVESLATVADLVVSAGEGSLDDWGSRVASFARL